MHYPDKGEIGDCFRTCIACILDLEPEDVPHFSATHFGKPDEEYGDLTWADVRNWLFARNLDITTVGTPGDWSLQQILEVAGSWCGPEVCYLLFGKSRNNSDHVVVCQNANIIHDPSIDRSGIVGPSEDGWSVAYFIPSVVREHS